MPIVIGTRRRRRHVRARTLTVGGCVALVFFAVGCGTSGHKSAKSVAPPRATDARGYNCLRSKLDFARRCPSNPDFRKTKTQLHAEAVAKAKAARHARLVAARAAAASRARLAREAAARRARIAAENAWHQGYNQQDDNVYWKWVKGGSCQDFAQYGCWHVAVTTRDGCPSYVAVNANEYRSGTIINSLLANQGYGIPPETPRDFELDADEGGVTAGNVTIECQ
jgi:hypothetical protein